MPHRTTYIFPRHFPEGGLDHEKEKLVNSIRSQTFGVETDPSKKPHSSSSTTGNRASFGKRSAVSDLFATGDKLRHRHKQVAAFCDWLTDKREDHSIHSEEDRDLLLPPPEKETAVDRRFDRQVSLPRLSSGSSSYAGSLFSGTTLDGNFSSGVKEETPSSSRLSTINSTTARRQKEEEESEEETLAKKCKESYMLQRTLANRLTFLASLVTEPILPPCTETWDADSVSYRLWVSGCLSYSDKISDGFYNILGMNPYLWVMCNDVEEGRRIPTLMALKAVEPSETSMEVVLVDRHEDSRLKLLHDKAQELYCASENTLVLVEQLGKLVAIYMGYTYKGRVYRTISCIVLVL